MSTPASHDLIELERVDGENFTIRIDQICHISDDFLFERRSHDQPRRSIIVRWNDTSNHHVALCWVNDQLHKIRRIFKLDRWLPEKHGSSNRKIVASTPFPQHAPNFGSAHASTFGWMKRGDLCSDDVDFWESPDGLITAVRKGYVPLVSKTPKIFPLDLFDEISLRDE